jgi:hypothetical protein
VAAVPSAAAPAMALAGRPRSFDNPKKSMRTLIALANKTRKIDHAGQVMSLKQISYFK